MSDYSDLVLPPLRDPNRVFTYYNPWLLRFPMQIIISSKDEKLLLEAVSAFISSPDIYKHDTLMVDNLVYIEYLNNRYRDINIPSYYWEIALYRQWNGLENSANIFGSKGV